MRVWYVAYGSNLSEERFRCYLGGGRPAGGARLCTGCRDPRSPRRRVSLEVSGGLYFAGESSVWSGGRAYVDPSYAGQVAARAYLVTAGQFSDVVAQETRRPVGTDLRLHGLGSGDVLGVPGLYYTRAVCVGRLDDVPLITMTAEPHEPELWAAPSAPYLATIAAGLREAHGWDDARISAYLASAGGVAPTWTAASIVTALRDR